MTDLPATQPLEAPEAEAYPYFRLGLGGGRSTPAAKVPTIAPRAPPKPRGAEAAGAADKLDENPYVPTPELSHAVNVALVLGMPLLVTGPPGTGKTVLADAVASDLGCAVHKFETKSTSQARELFYSFDAMDAFKAEPPPRPREPGGSLARSVGRRPYDARDYITYQALGRAILDACDRTDPALTDLLTDQQLAKLGPPRRSVVLIDEIDKAPRDFPNDLLNEIERLYFRVPELRNATSPIEDGRGKIPANLQPIIIITSNEERGLPAPFLRRCIFFEIPFPTKEVMVDIVRRRLAEFHFPHEAVDQAVGLFYELRRQVGSPEEGPSTAELLNWLQILGHRGLRGDRSLRAQSNLVRETISTLLKSTEARVRGLAYLTSEWPTSA